MAIDDLSQLYAKAKDAYPELVVVPDSRLSQLEAISVKNRRRNRITLFLALASYLPLGYVLASLSIAKGWTFAGEVASKYSIVDFRTALSAVPGLESGLWFFALANFTYFILVPVLNEWLPKLPTSKLLTLGDIKSSGLVIGVFLAAYVTTGPIIVLAAAKYKPSAASLRTAFLIWFTPLALVLGFIPIFVGALFIRLLTKRLQERHTTEADSISHLLHFLLDLRSVRLTADLTGDLRTLLLNRLKRASLSMRLLYSSGTSVDEVEEWYRHQMTLASSNVLVVASWISLPTTQTLQMARNRVVIVCNALFTYELDNLPRNAISDGLTKTPPRRRILMTAGRTLAVFCYCAMPLLGYLWLRPRVSGIALPDALLLMLYSLWIGIGIYAYLVHTSDDSRSLLMDLIKTVLGR